MPSFQIFPVLLALAQFFHPKIESRSTVRDSKSLLTFVVL